jgi:hypothetical protein
MKEERTMSETLDPQVPDVSDPDTSPAEPDVSDPGDETQDDQERYDGGDVPRTTETETETDGDED